MTPETLATWHSKFRGWIATIAYRKQGRMYGREDIEQEGYVVLWKILNRFHGKMPDEELVGLFKVSFENHIKNLFRRQEYKYTVQTLSYEINLANVNGLVRPDDWYDDKIKELLARTSDPSLKRWITRATKYGETKLYGMPKSIRNRVRTLIEACST